MNIFKDNPTFVLLLGLCPTLAVTTSAINAIGMGISTLLVLIGSNMLIAKIKNTIPTTIRIPVFIVIISTFVTLVQLVLKAFLPAIDNALGIYIPLIVVNCIILGRAESFASRNNVRDSALDAIEKGLGFTAGLLLIGTLREIIGNGTLFGYTLLPDYYPMLVMTLPPGAFLVMGGILATLNWIKGRRHEP